MIVRLQIEVSAGHVDQLAPSPSTCAGRRGQLQTVALVPWCSMCDGRDSQESGSRPSKRPRARSCPPAGAFGRRGRPLVDVSGLTSLFPRWREHTGALDAELARAFELPQDLPALDHQIAPCGPRR